MNQALSSGKGWDAAAQPITTAGDRLQHRKPVGLGGAASLVVTTRFVFLLPKSLRLTFAPR